MDANRRLTRVKLRSASNQPVLDAVLAGICTAEYDPPVILFQQAYFENKVSNRRKMKNANISTKKMRELR